ncbi:DUF4260 domain-containing protein [Nesterenkonia rhizosphaerae]|uniref:DUF4260 domain-containing protein n=1 Tax=Nesterenkonia rhizosphaerae TaxID=1348272 RepID=A0ABP9FNE8_9MICC
MAQHAATPSSLEAPGTGALGWQRLENALIAAAVLLMLFAVGEAWWWPLALFLVFDICALGYIAGERVGSFTYNLIHSYAGPAAVWLLYSGLLMDGKDIRWLLIIAASWTFHIGVDRALGYGLKLGPFTHTHLGRIGRSTERNYPSDGSSPG